MNHTINPLKTDNRDLTNSVSYLHHFTPQERAIWFKAVTALQRGNAGYTIRLMQMLLKKRPKFLAGRQLLRQAGAILFPSQNRGVIKSFSSLFLLLKARNQKDPYIALEILEKLLANSPYNKKANWLLYQTALTCNMPETAAFALETLLKGDSQDIRGMCELAKHYVRQNQPQKALEIYNKIVELRPADLIALQARRDAVAEAAMQEGGWSRGLFSF